MFDRWAELRPGNVLLLGPRRCGKTTLLRQRFPAYRYVTLDDFDALTWARRDPKGLVGSLRPAAIIDEIQRLPELLVAVKYWSDRGEIEALMTGSSSIGLMDAAAETLAGRVWIEHLPTVCWGEELGTPQHQFFEDEAAPAHLAEGRRHLERWLRDGGFPEVVASASQEDRADVLRLYRDSYFLRDVAQMANIENVEALHAIFQHVVRCIGSPVEVSNFAREAGLSHATAKRYLGTLLQTGLGFRLYGGQFSAVKRLVKAAKLYFADSGIVTAFQAGVDDGARFESFVVSEIEKRRKLRFFDADRLLYYRSKGGAKVDLIFEEPRSIRAVEIKFAEHVQPKDLRNLKRLRELEWPKPLKLYVVYRGMRYLEMDGVRVLPVHGLWRAR
ncbi:MAG: ATP-binding protein [Acidobacteriota bacterium]|mgnify:CR=1 FL=1